MKKVALKLIGPLTALCAAAMSAASAQVAGVQGRWEPLIKVNGDSVDQLRLSQLLGVQSDVQLLLRTPSNFSSGTRSTGWRLIPPSLDIISNSAMPFSMNDGALWAGRGLSSQVTTGVIVATPRMRLVLAPEILIVQNSDWVIRDPQYFAPTLPPDRAGGGYVLPYYSGRFQIDLPVGFGPDPIRRIEAGQSSFTVKVGSFDAGAATENEWWGPALRNPILLSSNAAGIPRLFIATRKPISTRLGKVEGRWFVGGLQESQFFDTVSTNNVRSIAALSAVLQTGWDPNLSVGVARSVFAGARNWRQPALRWFDVFANTGRPSELAANDSSQLGRRDQLISLFARWVFPNDGAEVYAELARMEFPANFRDLLIAPNHSQGYTLGFQWAKPLSSSRRVRLQGEITTIEQSATFRNRPVGSYYTSPRVTQGYTNRGQAIGSGIGPGASTQWFAADYFTTRLQAGAYLGRIRWNEDVHSNFGFPAYVAYCNHDVSIYPGFRFAARGKTFFASADLSLQNRLNIFFQNGTGCPNGSPRRDVRNRTLSLTFGTFGAGR